jgi:hypothetical protein
MARFWQERFSQLIDRMFTHWRVASRCDSDPWAGATSTRITSRISSRRRTQLFGCLIFRVFGHPVATLCPPLQAAFASIAVPSPIGLPSRSGCRQKRRTPGPVPRPSSQPPPKSRTSPHTGLTLRRPGPSRTTWPPRRRKPTRAPRRPKSPQKATGARAAKPPRSSTG